jgi:hypothetical protein
MVVEVGGKLMATDVEYQTLDDRSIIQQLQTLRNRVAERFPTRGLTKTASHLCDISRPTAREASALKKRFWGLRILSIMAIVAGAAGLFQVARFFEVKVAGELQLTEFTQALEAAFNIVLLSSIFLLFMVRLENRFKRERALKGLYRLRAIAHVIDMHQLTKDPPSITGAARTSSSPVRDLNEEQLLRYLDYCSEMLSFTGKLAALYAQHFPDATVITAVNDIEQLTTNLSRKIWQKIVLIQGNRSQVMSSA